MNKARSSTRQALSACSIPQCLTTQDVEDHRCRPCKNYLTNLVACVNQIREALDAGPHYARRRALGRERGTGATVIASSAASAARLSGDNGLGLVVFYVLILALFAFLPTILDLWKSYQNLPPGHAPQGMQGLTRGLIALTTILIIGIALFHLAIFGSPSPDITPILNNLLSLLGGLLAAIAGFYFGARSGQQAADAAIQVATVSTRVQQPRLAPTDVRAMLVEPRTVTVQWTPPLSPVGVNLTGYTITSQPPSPEVPALLTVTQATVSNLAQDTFAFRVTANYSDSTSATSAASAPVTVE